MLSVSISYVFQLEVIEVGWKQQGKKTKATYPSLINKVVALIYSFIHCHY